MDNNHHCDNSNNSCNNCKENNNILSLNNNSCNNLNNNNNDIDIFLKIIRNIYLKQIIFKHIKGLNAVDYIKRKHQFFNIKSLKYFKYREYLEDLEIRGSSTINEEFLDLSDFIDNTSNNSDIGGSGSSNENSSINNCKITPSSSTIASNDQLESNLNNRNNLPTNNNNNNISPNLSSINNISNNDEIKYLYEGLIPCNVKNLILYRDIKDTSILPNIIPTSVKRLTIDRSLVLEAECIPNSVEELILGDFSNFTITYEAFKQPYRINKLEFGNYYNKPIKPFSLPDSITHLSLGASFNQKLVSDSLPKHTQYLSLGNSYSQLTKQDIFNKSIKEIIFGISFTRAINLENLNSLETIVFRNPEMKEKYMNSTLIIPKSVKKLEIAQEIIEINK